MVKAVTLFAVSGLTKACRRSSIYGIIKRKVAKFAKRLLEMLCVSAALRLRVKNILCAATSFGIRYQDTSVGKLIGVRAFTGIIKRKVAKSPSRQVAKRLLEMLRVSAALRLRVKNILCAATLFGIRYQHFGRKRLLAFEHLRNY